MWIDQQTIWNFVEVVFLGLGLVFAGWMLAKRGEFIKRNLMINSFIGQMIHEGIMDESKFKRYMEKQNAKITEKS